MADWHPVTNASPSLDVIQFLDAHLGLSTWDAGGGLVGINIPNGSTVGAGWLQFFGGFHSFGAEKLKLVQGGIGIGPAFQNVDTTGHISSRAFNAGPTIPRFGPIRAMTRMTVFAGSEFADLGATPAFYYGLNPYVDPPEDTSRTLVVTSVDSTGIAFGAWHQDMNTNMPVCTELHSARGVVVVERWSMDHPEAQIGRGLYEVKAVTAHDGLVVVNNKVMHYGLSRVAFSPMNVTLLGTLVGRLGCHYFASGWASDEEVDRLLGWGLHRWGLQSYAPGGWVYRNSPPQVERNALLFGSGKLPEPAVVTLSARNDQVETGKILGLDSEVKDADGEVIINASPTLSISQGLSFLGSLHDEQGNTEFLVQAHTPGTFTLKAFYAGLESPSVQFSAVLPPEPAPIDTPTPPAPSEPDGVESTIGRIRFNGGAGVRLMFGSTRIRISGGMVRKVVPPKQPERPVGNPFKRQGRNR